MKTIIIFLFPVLLFSQTLPDTIYVYGGRTVPCLITSVDDSRIYFDFAPGKTESLVLQALASVKIDKLGQVFESGSGYLKNEDELNEFLADRLKRIEEKNLVQSDLDKVAGFQTSAGNIDTEKPLHIVKPVQKKLKTKDFNNWSFGVLYVPYYTDYTYIVNTASQYLDIYKFSTNLTYLEAQWTYALTPSFRLTFDAGYTSEYSEYKYEFHDDNSSNPHQGAKSITGLKRLDFNLGLKYFMTNIFSENVSVYAAFSIGKQFAFAEYKREQLYQTEPPYVKEVDNSEEYMEDLNSPWHFNLGFGAEYFFNESLSLVSNIRLIYASVSGNYKKTSTYQSYNNVTRTSVTQEERKESNFVTRIGLGLNFYF